MNRIIFAVLVTSLVSISLEGMGKRFLGKPGDKAIFGLAVTWWGAGATYTYVKNELKEMRDNFGEAWALAYLERQNKK